MKKIINLGLFLTIGLFLNLATNVTGQETYKDWVGENSNAETDIALVRNYLNALVDGELETATGMLADGYTEIGPSVADTTTTEKLVSSWQGNYKNHSNRKIGFVNITFRVLQGDAKGDWVSVWGTYNFTQNEKDISLSFQYSAKVANGKIMNGVIYYDRWHVYKTLGYTLTAPEE